MEFARYRGRLYEILTIKHGTYHLHRLNNNDSIGVLSSNARIVELSDTDKVKIIKTVKSWYISRYVDVVKFIMPSGANTDGQYKKVRQYCDSTEYADKKEAIKALKQIVARGNYSYISDTVAEYILSDLGSDEYLIIERIRGSHLKGWILC